MLIQHYCANNCNHYVIVFTAFDFSLQFKLGMTNPLWDGLYTVDDGRKVADPSLDHIMTTEKVTRVSGSWVDRWLSMMIHYQLTTMNINSLACERYWSKFKSIIIHNISSGTRCEIVLRWMPQNTTKFEGILPKVPYPPCLRMADRALLAGYLRNEKLTLIQVMAWCCQAWTNADPDLYHHMASLGYNG